MESHYDHHEAVADQLPPELDHLKLNATDAERGSPQVKAETDRTPTPPLSAIPPRLKTSGSRSQSPTYKKQEESDSPSPASSVQEETLGGDITLMVEPGKAPKLSRAASRTIKRAPPLYLDLPDSTQDAKQTFEVLPQCTYANKHIGTTDPALECDCGEEWDAVEKVNNACGEDSDCINRATKMECVADGCSCGTKCQNQRFFRKQYADVTVIKTAKKGFGLRANQDMFPGDFVFEYIGEVIDERTFRRRMIQYDEEGIKHFYFMSLTKGEFVDATKKGNLGRFCNHSCNPNCFVDKWVVGDKLRMGIFVERKVKAGEELVFNYNVDRYGADPQPCYCGEPNCTGYIGGKTQSDNATKLSHATIEALGIDDGDGWDTAVAKKPRKKKVSEDDEEYVNDLKPRSLEDDGVPKVMAALRQCTEKWIAVKLLSRIQQTDNERVGHRIIRMHGYETLKKTLTTFMDDFNVVQQVLDILHNLPRITRNKIQDSKIEEAVEQLKTCGNEQVQESAGELLNAWSKLEVAYRIPRMKRDPNAGTPARTENHFERRERGRERSRSRSKSPSLIAPKGPAAAVPSGPRGVVNVPRGPSGFFNAPRPAPRPRPFNPLPPGWFQATSDNGSTYYYNTAGTTQWLRPTQAANQPPPPPPKAKTDTQLLQDIISSITSNATPTGPSASSTPQPTGDEQKEKKTKSEKWRSLPQEKQEKIYEATLSHHVMNVAAHYRKKLEKDDIKRLSKEVAKKLVRGDYKSGRVKDPTAKLSSRHEKTVKNYVKEFMDKAVKKKEERDKKKAARAADGRAGSPSAEKEIVDIEEVEWDDDMMDIHKDIAASKDASPTDSSSELKRKREGEEDPGSPKKTRKSTDRLASAPPPPPPPPASDVVEIDQEYVLLTTGIGHDSSHGIAINSKVGLQENGYPSPVQLATPSTNGSHQAEQKTAYDDRA
ncbi:histone-lysine N-methyltransferase [Parastagonospora nodorum]|nr:histone-lysine N-methyltransferase [Parastagonospora nodorum]KAH4178258.1 histone-lysine N-methyltransferase [Parastagonospora nodorum]KAH4271212.1 histone-lysine N-methyltransferase [Parastagonospora nodorum]KAH4282020.1 histone-lysine N-methyltransferase [Parastagonospora nodorum]KAH4420300.1 histone-lysine N-methyltransferase [Parastagonospora nodorum]